MGVIRPLHQFLGTVPKLRTVCIFHISHDASLHTIFSSFRTHVILSVQQGLDYEQSLFFLWSVGQNARHANGHARDWWRVTEKYEKRETTRKAGEMRPSYASLSGSVFNVFVFGRRDFPTVLQPSSTCQWLRLLTACCQRFTNQPIVFCIVRPTHNSLALAKRAVSAGSLSRQFFSSWMT